MTTISGVCSLCQEPSDVLRDISMYDLTVYGRYMEQLCEGCNEFLMKKWLKNLVSIIERREKIRNENQ